MDCISKIGFNDTLCMPKCSGLHISNYDRLRNKEGIEMQQNLDIHNQMQLEILNVLYTLHKGLLPAPLTSWSKYCGRLNYG